MSTEEQRVQRNSGYRGTVVQRNSGYRGTYILIISTIFISATLRALLRMLVYT